MFPESFDGVGGSGVGGGGGKSRAITKQVTPPTVVTTRRSASSAAAVRRVGRMSGWRQTCPRHVRLSLSLTQSMSGRVTS